MTRCSFSLSVVAIFSLVEIAGCGGQSKSHDRDLADINTIATVYRSYTKEYGEPPPNEQAFRKYVNSLPMDKREQLKAVDVDGIFVSPRDQLPYVVGYGEATNGRIPDCFVYEKEGLEGKRWVANIMGYVSELDEAELSKKLGGKP
jgi:hypothetical protein